jgi:hypothetical protein
MLRHEATRFEIAPFWQTFRRRRAREAICLEKNGIIAKNVLLHHQTRLGHKYK